MQHHGEVRYKYFKFCPLRLKTVTALPCEIRKSYFSSLQQYDVVRNVTDSTRLMQRWNTRQAKSMHCSKWLSCARTRALSLFLPLINCFVHYSRLESTDHCSTADLPCIDSFLVLSKCRHPPRSVWPHLFRGAGHEKRRGEQLKWSLAFRLYIGSFPCAQLPGPVHTARLGWLCFFVYLA